MHIAKWRSIAQPQIYLWNTCDTCDTRCSSSENLQFGLQSYFGQVKTVSNPKAIHWAGDLWPLDLKGLSHTSLQDPPKPEGWNGLHLWVSQQFHFSCHCLCCYTLSCALWWQHCQQRVWFSFLCTFPPEEKVGILLNSHAFSFLH